MWCDQGPVKLAFGHELSNEQVSACKPPHALRGARQVPQCATDRTPRLLMRWTPVKRRCRLMAGRLCASGPLLLVQQRSSVSGADRALPIPRQRRCAACWRQRLQLPPTLTARSKGPLHTAHFQPRQLMVPPSCDCAPHARTCDACAGMHATRAAKLTQRVGLPRSGPAPLCSRRDNNCYNVAQLGACTLLS